MVDTEHRTAQILQNCLDAIQIGDETVDSVLSLYPDLEEELRPQLENALWLMDRRALLEPDPAFIQQSRTRLMNRIQAQQRAAAPVATSWKESFLAFFRLPPVVVRAAATVLLVFVLLMGADRVVESTETSVPGEPGYTVKRTVENFTLAVSNDPGQQIVLYLEYSQRRLSETNVLVDESRYTAANETLDEFQEQVRSAVSSLDSVKDADTVHKELLAMTIQEKLSDHKKQLDQLLPKVPPQTKAVVAQAMMVSNDGLAVAQTTVRRLSTMKTPVPGETKPAGGPGAVSPTDSNQLVPTEEQLVVPIILTPTDEYKQIYSSTAVPTKAPTAVPVLPTYPIVGPSVPTATPEPGGGGPTPVPTESRPPTRTPRPTSTPLPPPSDTPPPPDTSTPEPTLSGVTTATPVPPTAVTPVPALPSDTVVAPGPIPTDTPVAPAFIPSDTPGAPEILLPAPIAVPAP